MRESEEYLQAGKPKRALSLSTEALTLTTELHPLLSLSTGDQLEHLGRLLRSRCYQALGRLEEALEEVTKVGAGQREMSYSLIVFLQVTEHDVKSAKVNIILYNPSHHLSENLILQN